MKVSIRRASFAVAGVWLSLGLGHIASTPLGLESATLASFGCAWALVAWIRPRPEIRTGSFTRYLAWLPVGFVALPAILYGTWQVGSALGLSPDKLPAPLLPLDASLGAWVAAVVMAPAFEEPLYRGIVLQSLVEHIGRIGAVLVTSVLFALPHGGEWAALNAFLLGLILGTMAVLGISVGVCVAIHAGLNLACLSCGVPVAHLALSPVLGGMAAGVLTCCLLAFERARSSAASRIDALVPREEHAR